MPKLKQAITNVAANDLLPTIIDIGSIGDEIIVLEHKTAVCSHGTHKEQKQYADAAPTDDVYDLLIVPAPEIAHTADARHQYGQAAHNERCNSGCLQW